MGCQAFLRPIEISTANATFKTSINGAGAVSVTIPTGVYASVFTLAEAVRANLVSDTALTDVVLELTADFKFRIGDTDESEALKDFTLDFTTDSNQDLAMILGFSGNKATDEYHTADYTPSHLWLPTYSAADRQRFWLNQSRLFKGEMAQNGRLSGLTTMNNLYFREFEWPYEPVENVSRDGGTVFVTWAGPLTYYVHEDRCFENFVDKARTTTTVDNSNPTTKGFYYLPNWEQYVSTNAGDSPTTAIPVTMAGDGGVRFDLATNPDEYVYCHLDSSGSGNPAAALETGTTYYSMPTLSVHTATAPTWTAP